MANSPEEIKKAIKLYLFIGSILFVGTILTVLVATIPALDVGEHGFDKWDAIIGVVIASGKAFFVAYIFMHLNHEKKPVYWIFFGTFLFAFVLITLTYWAFEDPIQFRSMLPQFAQ